MITAIEIENFKAIRERVRVEFKPLTLLFGPNSAGKSTIVQALHYAREIFDRHVLDAARTALGGESVDLGGFEDRVHGHDTNLPIRLRFDLDLSGKGLPDYEVFESEAGGYGYAATAERERNWSRDISVMLSGPSSASVEVEITYHAALGAPAMTRYEVSIDGETIARTRLSEDGETALIDQLNFAHPVLVARQIKEPSEWVDLDDNNIPEQLVEIRALEDLFSKSLKTGFVDGGSGLGLRFCGQRDRFHRCSALPEWGTAIQLDEDDFQPGVNADLRSWLRLALSRILVGPGELLRNELRTFRYLGPLRAIPPRNYEPTSYGDPGAWANGLAAWSILYRSGEPFAEEVSGWLSRLKSGYAVRVKTFRELDAKVHVPEDTGAEEMQRFVAALTSVPLKKRVILVPEGQSIEVSPSDVGTGISQLLPVVVLALSAKDQLVAIEQPELHLHPALQAELGDLFAESALRDRNNTLILETHSEHLILRVMKCMRDTVRGKRGDKPTVRPEDVAVVFVEPTREGSVVHQLRLTHDGSLLDQWPGGFFEESFRELFG